MFVRRLNRSPKNTCQIDMRERNIAIDPQAAITKDNVSVEVSGNLYVQFVDPEKVCSPTLSTACG